MRRHSILAGIGAALIAPVIYRYRAACRRTP
jgi:hypothetical protein